MDNLKRIIDTDYNFSIHISSPEKGRAGVKISQEQIERIRELYPVKRSQAVADELGISRMTVSRYAKLMGLHKDESYLLVMNTERAKYVRSVQIEMQKIHPRKNWKSRFRKGHSPKERLDDEGVSLWRKRLSESQREAYRKEKMRVNFGLPQLSKRRVTRQDYRKVSFRSNLKKKGYVIDEESSTAYYDESTKRSKRMESRNQPWFTFAAKMNK